MNPTESTNSSPNMQPSECLTVMCEDRWQVYHRLKMLDIDCQCGGFQPLTVTIRTPVDALQLWSVVKQVSATRAQLVNTLNSCWKAPAVKPCE